MTKISKQQIIFVSLFESTRYISPISFIRNLSKLESSRKAKIYPLIEQISLDIELTEEIDENSGWDALEKNLHSIKKTERFFTQNKVLRIK